MADTLTVQWLRVVGYAPGDEEVAGEWTRSAAQLRWEVDRFAEEGLDDVYIERRDVGRVAYDGDIPHLPGVEQYLRGLGV